jgi:hypothetical protein
MIKVIDGKRYNTATSEDVFGYWNGLSTSDFGYRTKHLYRTKNAAWFLHHDGGAMSDMSVSVRGGRSGSEDIEPVSDDDAFGFLQAHSDERDAQKAIETYFADRVTEA